MKTITQEYARELFDYDPSTGLLTWRTLSSPKSRVRVGDIVGYIHSDGYRRGLITATME